MSLLFGKKEIQSIALLLVFGLMELKAQSLQEFYAQGTNAYKAGDHATFLKSMQSADSIRPNHPTILYNLAAGYALNELPQRSVDVLERVIWMNAEIRFDEDEDFLSLKDLASYRRLRALQDDLLTEVRKNSASMTLSDSTFHPEGIAYSMTQDKYFLGSVRKRKIVSSTEKGEVEDFLTDGGLMSIMGLKVDDQKELLWACSTPTPEMMGDETGLRAEVIAIDLNTRKVVGRYLAPNENDWLGDLTITSTGVVLVSNSSAENPTIYQVNPGKDTLSTLIDATELVSIQGITLSRDESVLFIADYRHGILKYDFESKELIALENKTPHSLKGIDGLYSYHDDLIAIHNGLKPFRVVRYSLDKERNIVKAFSFLEKALPEMNEPTLGLILDNDFLYVTNSPWAAYDADKVLDLDLVSAPLIRKISLK